MAVDDATRKRIDKWLRENPVNEFGDRPDTVYMGGTPLFNEMTGRTVDKYDYILKRHPELRQS